MKTRPPRLSLGGHTVSASLTAAGFDVATPEVALVETARARGHHQSVLVQSAWNVIPVDDFWLRLRPYPAKMRARAVARRMVARRTMARAEGVVCLTQAMASLTTDYLGREVLYTSVTLPMDTIWQPQTRAPEEPSLAVVPGTLTWYKRPQDALETIANQPDLNVDRVRFLGTDDGSGCSVFVERRARQLGLRYESGVVGRDEFRSLCGGAGVVILPSSLESLGFALAEALAVTDRVLASHIPAHVEITERLGGAVGCVPGGALPAVRGSGVTSDEVAAQWRRVGEALGLRRAGDE